jgi:hypothetical protein
MGRLARREVLSWGIGSGIRTTRHGSMEKKEENQHATSSIVTNPSLSTLTLVSPKSTSPLSPVTWVSSLPTFHPLKHSDQVWWRSSRSQVDKAKSGLVSCNISGKHRKA